MVTRRKAFTLVELLTVIGIISLLLGIALPALNEARIRAREVAEKAVISNMSTAVENFANDMGHYPESGLRSWNSPSAGTVVNTLKEEGQPGADPPDQGAHRLVEALLGLDFLGYEKDHFYKVNDNQIPGMAGVPIKVNLRTGAWEEARRYGPYMELKNVTVKTMQEAHPNSENFGPNANDNYVFVDNIDRTEFRPILYYRARSGQYSLESIYNYGDNYEITEDRDTSRNEYYYLPEITNQDERAEKFYRFIWDEKTGLNPATKTTDWTVPSARPYNSNSFLLINAGRDHKFFTADDITNFK